MQRIRCGLNLIIVSWLGVLSACGGGDDGVVGTGFAITGAATKGPFQKDSEVRVSVLDGRGDATTQTLITYTKSDLGDFTFNLAGPGLARVIVDGYQLNELSGNWSNSKLSLRALTVVGGERSAQSVFVNVLTHITYDRVMGRLSESPSVVETIAKCEEELLVALNSVFPVVDVPEFNRLSVYNFDPSAATGNAYLLALSAALYQYATVQARQHNKTVDAELALALRAITEDFGDDGVIQNTALLVRLKAASRQLRPDEIAKNLRIHGLLTATRDLEIANLDLYLDTDNDGVVNAVDTDDDGDGTPDATDTEPYGQVVADMAILSPAAGSVLTGTITVRGTASETTQTVLVKLGNGSFVVAEGTLAWEVQFNTKEFGNVDAEIVVRAMQPDWTYVEKKLSVSVKNEKIVVVPIFFKPT